MAPAPVLLSNFRLSLDDPRVAGTGIHATAVVYGEHGVLIVGPSGAGKSALALALIAHARRCGDRLGRLWATIASMCMRTTAGWWPRARRACPGRSSAATPASSRSRASAPTVIRLVVDLGSAAGEWPRLPEVSEEVSTIEGVCLPRLALASAQSAGDQAIVVDERLRVMSAGLSHRKRISLEQCAALHKNERLAASLTPNVGREPAN